MPYLKEYQSKELCDKLLRHIHMATRKPLCFMEVCGGHTMSIRKFGLPSLLPPQIRLLSGPGCPVCVTSSLFIEQAIHLASDPNNVVCTFGDLLRVPANGNSLEKARAKGAGVRIVFSSLQALTLASENPAKNIIFLAIGFETTSPGTAAAIVRAKQTGTDNFFVLSAHKVMAPAMEAIISANIPVDGYICPGHVSTITGSSIYEKLAGTYRVGCVIAGFEPLDLLQSIYMLVMQVSQHNPRVEIQYSRAVKPEGNTRALALMKEVFEPVDGWWRGLGILCNSELKPRAAYRSFNASEVFILPQSEEKEPAACICGEVLKGLKQPPDCSLYAKKCTPDTPVGACMVSAEGTCQTFYHYDRNK